MVGLAREMVPASSVTTDRISSITHVDQFSRFREVVVPGLFGFFQKPDYLEIDRGASIARLDAMAATMAYEPFYVRRTFHCSELGIYAGWVGHLEAATSSGPVTDASTGVTAITTGEPRVDAAPDAFRAQRCRGAESQLLNIIGAYASAHELFPDVVHGAFSGLLIDKLRQRSLLFTDRFGMERVFVYDAPDAYFFASEAKAILAVVAASRAFDPDGVAEFLTTGCTLGDRSLFLGIRILPGGTVLAVDRTVRPVARKYFSPADWEESSPLSEGSFLDRLGKTLRAAIARDVQHPGGVAMSLTGGLDSRMIMANLDVPPGGLPCYTFGSMYRDTFDVKVARRVAAICHQPHQVLRLDHDFVAALPSHFTRAVFISDGYLGLSGAAELYVNALARRVAPVRVTGNYGGELLRSFRAFKSSVPTGDFLERDLVARAEQAVRTFAEMGSMPALSFTLFRQVPSGFGRYAIERSQVGVRSPFLDEQLLETLYRRPSHLSEDREPSTWLIARRKLDLLDLATDRGFLGRGGRLRRRAVRLYREGLFKAEYLTGHGTPPWLAPAIHRVPGVWLERAFTGRHKFVHPRTWFRNGLGDFVRDTLMSRATLDLESLVDIARVRSMVARESQGRSNHWSELDKVTTLALVSRTLLKLQIQ